MKDFEIKNQIKPLLSSMRDFNEYEVKKQLEFFLNDNSQIKMCYPFGEFNASWFLFKISTFEFSLEVVFLEIVKLYGAKSSTLIPLDVLY